MLASLFAKQAMMHGRGAGRIFQNTGRFSYSLSLVTMYALYQQYTNVRETEVIFVEG